MKSFQELYTELQDMTGETSVAQLVIFKRHINDTDKLVSAKAPFLCLETTATKTTVASQEGYQIPNTIQRIRSVKVTLSGGTIYRPRPVEDPRYWEYLQSLQAGDSDSTRFYMKQGNQILLWPEPATTGSTITIRGRRRLKDLSLTDYTTGTISAATITDETITGASTSWATNAVGNWIRIDYTYGDFQWYEISSITSTTVLELVKPYEGATFTGQAETYKIGEFSYIPGEYHPLLIYRPLAIYYAGLEDVANSERYWRMYDGGKEAGLSDKTGGLLRNLIKEDLSRNEGVYVEPLQTEELSIEDFIIPNEGIVIE
jgi:hypothetical protein